MAKIRSWEVSDEFWKRVEPFIPKRKREPDKIFGRKPGGGRKANPERLVFEGIVCVLRTGCQWNSLPGERFGSASSVHKYFRQWLKAGFFLALWRAGLAEYDEMEGIAWKWQSMDRAMVKAPLAQEAVGPNPTDRGKKGTKRHILVDGRGVPLSLIATGANRHDVTQLTGLLAGVVVALPRGRQRFLYADKGYDGEPARNQICWHGYISRVARKKRRRGRPPKNRR
jgi:transposase